MTKATLTIHAAALFGGLLAVTDSRGREVPLLVGEDHTITLNDGDSITVKLAAKPERAPREDAAQTTEAKPADEVGAQAAADAAQAKEAATEGAQTGKRGGKPADPSA